MSDKQTMQLEYQFIAEDVNLSSVINKMETNLENFNGESEELIKNLSRSEDSMKSFANEMKTAKQGINTAKEAINHFNSNAKTISNTMEELGQDIAKATNLTKNLAKAQDTLSQKAMKATLVDIDQAELKQLERDINTYRSQLVELNKLENKIASGYSGLKTNRDIALTGYKNAKSGSKEEAYFLNKLESIDGNMFDYKNALNQVSSYKKQLQSGLLDANQIFDEVAKKNRLELVNAQGLVNANTKVENSFNNKTKNSQQTLDTVNELNESLKNLEKTSKKVEDIKVPEVDTKGEEKSQKRTRKAKKDTDSSKEEESGTKSSRKSKKITNGSKNNQKIAKTGTEKEQKITKKGPVSTASKDGKVYVPKTPIRGSEEELEYLKKRNKIEADSKKGVYTSKEKEKAKTQKQLHEQELEYLKEETKAEKEKAKVRAEQERKTSASKADDKIRVNDAKADAEILKNAEKTNNEIHRMTVESYNKMAEQDNKTTNQMIANDNQTANQMKKNNQVQEHKLELMDKEAAKQKEINKAKEEEVRITNKEKSSNKVNEIKTQSEANIARDNNKHLNNKDLADYKNELKVKSGKELIDYRNEVNQLSKLNTTRENLIDNLNKEANGYDKIQKSASNYKADLDDIEKRTDKVIQSNVLYSDSFDSVDKSLRGKDKSLLTLSTRTEEQIVNTKKLIQSSMDYKKVLEDTKSSLKGQIQSLEKQENQTQETALKLDKLKNELNETESTIKELDSAMDRLNSSMNSAGAEVQELGNSYQQLENKIEQCKAEVSSFENKVSSVSTAGAKVSSTMAGVGKNITSFGKGVRSVGADITNLGREMQVLSVVGAGIFGSSFKLGMDYEGELANVRATLNTVGKEAGYADKAMDKISDKVREISSNSIYSPSETMEMAKYLSLAGYDLDKILSTIEPMSQLMSLTGIEDAAEGVDLLTDSFASLGLGIKQANESDIEFAEKFEKEVELYMDTLARMQSVSNQDISQAMEAYIYAGGEFDRLNIPLEQSGALLSVLASRGLKSAEAGRGLSSTLINLTKETGQSYEALKELNSLTGIDVFARFDSEGNYKLEQQLTNISDAFEKIYDKYGNSKGAEIVNRLTGGIAGKTQIKTFSKLLEGYRLEYTEIRDLLSKGTVDGSMDSMMEEKTKSIEYKFKMMTASIQESLVSLFDVIKPYIEKAIETITQLSDAFRNLSDGDKLQLAKLLGFATILPFIVMAIGAVVQVVGTAISAVGTLATGFFKLGGGILNAISKFAKLKGLMKSMKLGEALGEVFPTLKPIIDEVLTPMMAKLKTFGTTIAGVFTSIVGKVKAVFAGIGTAFTSGGIIAGFKAILALSAKVVAAIALIASAFLFLKDLFSNWGDLGFFASLEHAFINLVNTIGECIAKIIGLLNKDWGDAFKENFASFESSADIYAKEQGYAGYDEMKKQQSQLSQIQKQANALANGDYTMDFGINFSGFDGITGTINNWSNGAIGRLIEGMNNGSVGEVSSETVNDYQGAVADVVSQYEYIQNLRKKGNQALEDENKLTKKMLKTREEMAKHSKDCADYQRLQNEYNELYEQKNSKTQFRIANQEELDAKLKEYEENALVIAVKYEEAKKNGVGDEFFYENFGEYFQQEFGVELVFKNKEESVNSLNKLKENIPELKEGILIELQTADGEYENQLMSSLVELEKLELSIPVALEIIDTENKLLKFFGENNELDKSKNKESELKTTLSGLKKGSKAWEETNKQYKEAQKNTKNLQTEYDGLIDSLNKLKEENPQVFDNATQLAKVLTGNPNFDLTHFLTGDKYVNGNANNNSEAKKFINENYNTNGTKKTEQQKLAEQKKKEKEEAEKNFVGPKPATPEQKKEAEQKKIDDYVSNFDYVNPHGMPILKPGSMVNQIKEKLGGEVKEAKETVEGTTINMPTVNADGSTPITENTTADVEGAQNKLNETSFTMPEVDTESTPITDNVETDVEGAQSSLESLQSKAEETLSAFGSIDMSNLVEVFATVLALADEVRQRIIDIGNVANNHLKNCLQGSADGLLEQLSIVREQLIGIGNVANNYVRSSISGMLDGFMENIGVAREAVIGLGNVANNYLKNCLNGAGDGLKTSLQSAREVLLSICNVALNRGVNSMQSVGQSLSTSMNGARDKLLSICNVALFRGVSAMASMGNALSSSLSGALSIVNRVASVIDGAVRKANNIKIPTIPTAPTVGVASLSAPQSLSNMLRGSNLTNSSSSTINTSSSSFNFAIDKVIASSNADLKNSARRLTTYCKRKGLF